MQLYKTDKSPLLLLSLRASMARDAAGAPGATNQSLSYIPERGTIFIPAHFQQRFGVVLFIIFLLVAFYAYCRSSFRLARISLFVGFPPDAKMRGLRPFKRARADARRAPGNTKSGPIRSDAE